MGTVPLNYWYDSQLRRYTSQFCRVFQNFTYQTGRKGPDGNNEFRPVPVRHGMTNRQVAHILAENSENIMLSVPMISCYISDIRVARNRTQSPYYQDRTQIIERQYDEENQMYTTEPGDRYQLDRIMPVPYDVTLRADIWVSNQLQKDQLFEQLGILFNPAIDLQGSQNPYDWGALTILELEDVTYNSGRQMPIGTTDDIDMFSMTFKSEFWLQPPSYLHPQKLIHQIITNIGELNQMEKEGLEKGWDIEWSTSDLLARVITTPMNHMVRIIDDEVTLLGPNASEIDEHGEIFDWKTLIDQLGTFRPNISQVRIKTTSNLDDETTDIIGTFNYHPTEPNKLIWYVDGMTLPSTTMSAINGALDPHITYPGNGLPAVQDGQRYLLLSDIGDDTIAWGNNSQNGPFTANANDIIEFSNGIWQVVFVSAGHSDVEFVYNSRNGKRFKWVDNEWQIYPDGEYFPGFWRIFL